MSSFHMHMGTEEKGVAAERRRRQQRRADDDDGGDDDTQKGLDSVAEEAEEADSLLTG
jgi:hypothetical protein